MDPLRPLDILTVGHSYCVALNRRLCREVARAGGDRVAVTVAAPSFYRGDLRPISLEPLAGEPYALEPVPTYASRLPHVFLYGRRLGALLARPWDVVHAWEEPYIFAGGQVAAWTSRRSSLVFSSFQNQPKRFPPPFAQVERYALARSSGWTAFGHTVAANLAGRPGYRDRPHATIPLGVDLDAFRPDPAARRATLAALGWSPRRPPRGRLPRPVRPREGPGIADELPRCPAPELLACPVRRRRPDGGRPPRLVRPPPRPRPRRDGRAARRGPRGAQRLRHPGRAEPDHAPLEGAARPDAPGGDGRRRPRGRQRLRRDPPRRRRRRTRSSPRGTDPRGSPASAAWSNSPSLRDDLRARGLDRARSVYAWPRVAAEFLAFFRSVREAGPPRG